MQIVAMDTPKRNYILPFYKLEIKSMEDSDYIHMPIYDTNSKLYIARKQ
jgi:hypothetical protein